MHTRRERQGDCESSHGIDLAPMLDFVVNLLIFFIVAAVFVKESAVTMKRSTNTGSGSGSIADSIEVHDDGEIVIGGRAVDLRSVRANVERMIANDRKSVLIVADENAPTGTLVGVVDQVHLGGIDDVTFTTAR
ncbi:MAG TPA: biopolymer transporter ExbD [Gammaproteobacteria bacterium]|jgi:biopolymer transport protein ExbD|nr:biopolymer transporter ExbD [Gammaproteobacteria bacterium]